jgi:hypothetical protein
VLNRLLYDPDARRPILIAEEYYRRFVHAGGSEIRPPGTSPPMLTAFNAMVLLPGPYAACSPEAGLREERSSFRRITTNGGNGPVPALWP